MASDSSCGNAALFISAVFAVTCLMCERSCEPILEKLTAVNGWLCPIHFALVPLRSPVTLWYTFHSQILLAMTTNVLKQTNNTSFIVMLSIVTLHVMLIFESDSASIHFNEISLKLASSWKTADPPDTYITTFHSCTHLWQAPPTALAIGRAWTNQNRITGLVSNVILFSTPFVTKARWWICN